MKTYHGYKFWLLILIVICCKNLLAATKPTEASASQQDKAEYYRLKVANVMIFSKAKDLFTYMSMLGETKDKMACFISEMLKSGDAVCVTELQPLVILATKESSIGEIAKVKLQYNGASLIGYTCKSILENYPLDEMIELYKKRMKQDADASQNW